MTSLRQVVARTPIRVVVPLVVLLGLTGLYPAIVQAQVVASDQSWTTLGSFRQDQTRSAKLQRLRVAFNKLGYTDKRFFDKLDPEPSPQSFAVLGKLSDERTLLAQLRIDHPTAELKPDNFMVVAKKATAKRPGLPGVTICAAFTDKRTGEVVGMVLNTYRQTTRGVVIARVG